MKDVANAVEAAAGGQKTTTQYDVDGRYFYVRVMEKEQDFQTVSDVAKIILTSSQDNGAQVPLMSVASVVTTFGPLQINHYNSKRAACVQFTIQDLPLSEVFREVITKINTTVPLPVGYAILPFGAVNELRTLMEAVRFVFPLSVVSGLLAACDAVSVLYATVGHYVECSSFHNRRGTFLVRATGIHFDSFTMLGYILMVGLVVKNAILLITYAVQLMEDHCIRRDEALVLASRRRMRPIFMTAIAMVLGMLPLALKHGAGAEIYNGLAIAVVGGLSVATLFTLIFIPVVYTLLDDLKNRFWKIQPVRLEDE